MANYVDKNCKICGTIYSPTSPSSKVCSEECKVENRRNNEKKLYYNNKEVRELDCQACGIIFSTTDSRKIYCGSAKCEKIRQRRKNKRELYTLKNIKELFALNNYTLLSKEYKGYNTKLECLCPLKHEWLVTLHNFKRGVRCKECDTYLKKLSFGEVKRKFELEGYLLQSTSYSNNKEKLDFLCPEKHFGSITWQDFSKGVRCGECYSISRKVLIEDINLKFKEANYTLLSKVYVPGEKLKYSCSNKHINTISWPYFKKGYRCNDCSLERAYKQAVKGFESSGYIIRSQEKEYYGSKDKLHTSCPEGHAYFVSYNNFISKDTRCTICSNNGSSKAEKELCDIFRGKGLKIIENSRQIIKPYELDIYFPEHKVAVEYCGLYWHGEEASGKSRQYHRMKMDLCEEKGIRLITIFEDEFVERPNIVESRISNALGLSSKTIFARKCSIEEIDNKVAKLFLEANHLQGNVGCKKSFGLSFEGELVQVMTFGSITRKHASNGGKSLELKRLSSLPNINVVGGASRLFKQGKKWALEEGYSLIKSYCDMRWANSKSTVYSKLGFELEAETKYSPHYTKSQKRYRNFSLRKTPEERLTGKTEWELRLEQGFDRIWDCGHRTYVYKL